MKKIFLFILCLLQIVIASAQNPQLKEFYSGSNNYFLFADGDFVWQLSSPFLIKRNINTNQVQYFSYQNTNLPNTFFSSMLKDKQGRYWIASSVGLIKFENGIFSLLDTSNSSIPSNSITNLTVDSLDRIWFTTEASGKLIKFDGNNQFTQYSFANLVGINSYTNQIQTDNLNNVWLLQNDSGFIKFNGIVFSANTMPKPPVFYHYYSTLFFIDTSHNIYLLDHQNIFKYNGVSWSSIYQTTDNLHKLYYDGKQYIWFSTFAFTGGGQLFSLHKYKISSGTIINYSTGLNGLNDYFLESMVVDKNNAMWLGYDGSLQKLAGTTWNTYYNEIVGLGGYTGIIPDYNGTLCVTGYGGTLGANGEGALNFYDGHDWKNLTQYNSALLNDKIAGIVKDKLNNLWIRAENSTGSSLLYKYDGQLFTSFNIPASFMYGYYHSDMFIDSLNRIWFSYSDRIYKFNNGVWTEFPISGILGLPTNCGFKGMTMDKLGNLWLLVDHSNTFYGIAKFNGTNWGFIPHSSALPSIGKISCDTQNRIMVPLGTEGLHIFDGVNWSVDSASGGNITSITNAVSDNYGKIYAIDNNQKLFYRNGNSWVNFTSTKLISNTYNSTLLCDKNNNIYFGGEGNLIVYNSSPLGLNFSWDKSRIKGTVFYDGNQNKIEDSTETGLGGQKINLLPDSTTYFSSMNGDYSIPVDAGNHSISNVTQTNWTLTTDSSMYNFHIDTTDICCYNFGKYPTVFTDSLEAHITSFSRMRCGFDVSYAINYRNLGTNVNSGRLAMIKSDSLTFLTANPSPTSVSNDSLFWNFTNLNPGQERIIYLTCKVPLTSGLDICAKIVAQKYSAGNNYTTLYSDSSCSTVTCSFDPNEKEALPHGLYDQHYTIKKDALEYIIRFQNLGNDTAFNIIVKDTLSPKLNFSSFEVIGYSHPLTASINSKGIAEFRFTNIKLPNDEVNEPGSHGFVRYKMQPKQGLPDATKINNSAQIYFDFNAPIFTNNVFNTLVDSLNFIGINETNLIQNGVAIYPNPASDKLTVNFRNKESRNYDIIDITGRIVNTGKLSENNSVLNVAQLIPSIYFIRIIGSKTNYSVKFMKQ